MWLQGMTKMLELVFPLSTKTANVLLLCSTPLAATSSGSCVHPYRHGEYYSDIIRRYDDQHSIGSL